MGCSEARGEGDVRPLHVPVGVQESEGGQTVSAPAGSRGHPGVSAQFWVSWWLTRQDKCECFTPEPFH